MKIFEILSEGQDDTKILNYDSRDRGSGALSSYKVTVAARFDDMVRWFGEPTRSEDPRAIWYVDIKYQEDGQDDFDQASIAFMTRNMDIPNVEDVTSWDVLSRTMTESLLGSDLIERLQSE